MPSPDPELIFVFNDLAGDRVVLWYHPIYKGQWEATMQVQGLSGLADLSDQNIEAMIVGLQKLQRLRHRDGHHSI